MVGDSITHPSDGLGRSVHRLLKWVVMRSLCILWAQVGGDITMNIIIARTHTHTRFNTAAAGKSIATRKNQRVTYHITNGGDVSDSHLVYSVPLTAIFIK